MPTKRSRISGRGMRKTTIHSDGSSTDETYVNGKLRSITDHDRSGKSHDHVVVDSGLFPSKGARKK